MIETYDYQSSIVQIEVSHYECTCIDVMLKPEVVYVHMCVLNTVHSFA